MERLLTDFTLPELGEQIEAGDVLRVLVKVGDTLAREQPVVELETDKATIEVPSSVAGRITEIKVKVGDKVKVGQAILSYEEGASAPGGAKSAEAAPPKSAGDGGKAAAPTKRSEGGRPGASARSDERQQPAAPPVEKIDGNEELQPEI